MPPIERALAAGGAVGMVRIRDHDGMIPHVAFLVIEPGSGQAAPGRMEDPDPANDGSGHDHDAGIAAPGGLDANVNDRA